MLETETGSGDEAQNNIEIIMVQNALVEAIDRFHLQCFILGIAQSETNLPSEITKSGRLEKSIQMLPPTQLQRIKIWEYILSRHANGRQLIDSNATNDDLSVVLASSTVQIKEDNKELDDIKTYKKSSDINNARLQCANELLALPGSLCSRKYPDINLLVGKLLGL